jgi:hypothetical protein
MAKVTSRGRGDWHNYVDSVLHHLPTSASIRSQHKSFNDAFRSSRLATIPKLTSEPPNFYTRHQQYHPNHQVISSFNAAHRRGDWGLKRPLPPVRDSNIIVSELDSQERQTPFTFATEKPRFLRRMKELGLKLKVPSSDASMAKVTEYCLAERQARRPHSPLEHLHPQWNRKTGAETGPWLLGMDKNAFARYLRGVRHRRPEINAARSRLGQYGNDEKRTKQLVAACLDIPLRSPPYRTHPTAGLTYSAEGLMTTPTADEQLPRGRIIRNTSMRRFTGTPNALLCGIVAQLEESASRSPPERNVPKTLVPRSASISRSGRLEIIVSQHNGTT